MIFQVLFCHFHLIYAVINAAYIFNVYAFYKNPPDRNQSIPALQKNNFHISQEFRYGRGGIFESLG